MNSSLHQKALSVGEKGWKNLRDRTSDQHLWLLYNAYMCLCKALQGQKTLDKEIWAYIITELEKEVENKNSASFL